MNYLYSKFIIKIEFKNLTDTFLKDILNEYLLIFSNKIDLYNLKSYKLFHIFRNVKRDKCKLFFILTNSASNKA